MVVLKEPYARFIAVALALLSVGLALTIVAMRTEVVELHRSDDVVLSVGEEMHIPPPEGSETLLYIERSAISFSSNATVNMTVLLDGWARSISVPKDGNTTLDLNYTLPEVSIVLTGLDGQGKALIEYDYVVLGYRRPYSWFSLPGAILVTSGLGLLFIGLLEKIALGRTAERAGPESGKP